MNLELVDICKKFSNKEILKKLNISFFQGKIQALMGENGAGKSTTANIISGILQPDSGYILIDKKKTVLSNAKTAISKGICYVHQRPLLCDTLTIKENLLIGLKKDSKKNIPIIANTWLKDLDLNSLVKDISSDFRFFISLAGELLKQPKLLILDEPTALLNDEQRDFLFKNLRDLANHNMNIIIITHYKEEAEKYCDSISYLEDGVLVESISQQKEYDFQIAIQNNNFTKSKKYELQIENLTLISKKTNPIFDISFLCKSGSITLIQGLGEDGMATLEDAICGMKKATSGKIILRNSDTQSILFSKNLKSEKYNTFILRNKMGIKTGIIPTNKKYRGSNPKLTISQILLEKNQLIETSEVNISQSEKASNLSGGMLQKLLFAREFDFKPDLLILCHSLQGLDSVSMRKNIEIINNSVKNGAMALVLTAGDFPCQNELCTYKYYLKKGHLIKMETPNE